MTTSHQQVPALVYSPSHIPEEQWGREYGGLMHVTDWLPTLATAVNFKPSGRCVCAAGGGRGEGEGRKEGGKDSVA